jgi:putative NIF3 family GTP cyclohydrolase 1 type 2
VKVLLDENMPHQLRVALAPLDAATAVFVGFGGYENGKLLEAAEKAGFDVLVTGDLSLEYEQNLTARKIAIVSLSANSWRIIRNHLTAIVAAIESAVPGSFIRVECGRFSR